MAELNDDGITYTGVHASGQQFKEAADDFVTPEIKGNTYKLYFDMADIKDWSEMTTFIEKRVNGLKMYGYDVTDIYFFDHCTGSTEKVTGLYFGETVYVTATQIEDKGKDLTWDRILPEGATVHFRHCWVGNENNRDLLKNLATWTNRSVTGGTDTTEYKYPWGNGQNSQPYDPGWELGGSNYPDYSYGSLWGASPGGDPYEIWPEKVGTTLLEQLIDGLPEFINNPTPRPY